jgi:hypothetical protein
MVCRLCIKVKMDDKPYKATSTARTFKHLVIFHRQQLPALHAAQKIADNFLPTEPLLHVTAMGGWCCSSHANTGGQELEASRP